MMRFLTTMQTILLTISLFGCYTPEKANKALNKAYNKQKNEVAKFTRNKFPCIVTASDTIYNTEYDFVEIECPDQQDGVKDTVYLTNNVKTKIVQKTKDKTIALPQKTITIIQKVEDSAKLYVLQTANKDCSAKVEKLTNKVTKRNYWILSLLILLLISLFFNFMQFTGRSILGYFSALK